MEQHLPVLAAPSGVQQDGGRLQGEDGDEADAELADLGQVAFSRAAQAAIRRAVVIVPRFTVLGQCRIAGLEALSIGVLGLEYPVSRISDVLAGCLAFIV